MSVEAPLHPNEFWESLYRHAVKVLRARGVPQQHVEDPAQQAVALTWQRPDIYDVSPRKLYPEVATLARWRYLDGVKSAESRRTTTLYKQAENGGEEFVIDPADAERDMDFLVDVRRLFARANPRFERRMRRFLRRSSSQRKLYRAVAALARQYYPDSPIERLNHARGLVFSGLGDEKRDAADLIALAARLGKSTAAVATALSRLQAVWRAVEVAAYREAGAMLNSDSGIEAAA